MTAPVGPAPAPRAPAQVRNVAVVGHSGAGKTTLVEALLLAAGAVPRMGDVQDGTTTCDADEVEHALGHSVSLAVAPLEHRGTKVNLLDTPGSPDHAGALRAGLRAADGVLFVVSAAGGLDPVTVQLWSECEAAGTPRAVAVTQLDRARADFDEAVALCQRLLSDEVLPLQLPMHDDDGSAAGLISLLDQRVVDHSTGARVERGADPEHLALVADLRADLVETVLAESEDETLLDRYLDGEELDPALVLGALHAGVAAGRLHPALAVAPLAGVGTTELLDLLVDGFPSPVDHPCPPVTRPDGSPAAPLSCDPVGPLAAEVVRTTRDVQGGQVSYVRVFSGTLTPEAPLHAADRTGRLHSPLGAALRPVASCPAGDVCAVTGLSARTGDTLSSPADPLLLAPWQLPEPQLPVALEADDGTALADALDRLAQEDPTVRVERGAQLVLWCLGEGHADVLVRRLAAAGVAVRKVDVVLPPRETVAGPHAGALLDVVPGAPGSGVVVRGAAPDSERALRARAERGVTEGRPLVDVEVVLVHGDLRADAAVEALTEAVVAAGTVLLEPWSQVELHVPTAFARTVVSDLRGRRARVLGSEVDPEDEERSVVHAQLPDAELLGYATALRAVSHATGSFRRTPLGWEPAQA